MGEWRREGGRGGGRDVQAQGVAALHGRVLTWLMVEWRREGGKEGGGREGGKVGGREGGMDRCCCPPWTCSHLGEWRREGGREGRREGRMSKPKVLLPSMDIFSLG